MWFRSTRTDVEMINTTSNGEVSTVCTKGTFTIKSSKEIALSKKRLRKAQRRKASCSKLLRLERLFLVLLVLCLLASFASLCFILTLHYGTKSQVEREASTLAISYNGSYTVATSNSGAHPSNTSSTQSGTGASTGTIDLERLKQLESNITALKQKIAPQQVQIASLINSTLQNERTIKLLREALDSEKARTRNLNNTINSLGMTLESEQAKSWSMNQTMKNYEARLIDEERKTMEHSKTLLQLRALHDALKNATSMTSQALAANITELNSRLEEILSTMQSINQTTNIANLQSMIEKESIHRKGNDSVLFALVNSSTVARQESVAALTSDISAVKRMSMQNISNLEARLSSSINTQVTRLGTDDQILFSQVSNVNQTLLQMIQNVSLTPGPQGPTGPSGPMGAVGPVGPTGPAGAGNLTDCNEHSDSISTTAISVNVIGTYSKTTRQLMGYTCYATVPAGISFADDPIGKRCTCDAVSAPGKLWTCKITVFTCPKTS